jgi:hypothetical protein
MLPSSRNTTYTPSAPVKSADLNAIQDAIVGGGHGPKWINLPPVGPTSGESGNVGYFTSGEAQPLTAAATIIRVAFPLCPGARILRCRAHGSASGAGMTVDFVYWNGLGSGVDGEQVLATLAIPNNGADHAAVLSPVMDIEVGMGGSLFAVITMSLDGAAHRCSTVGVLVSQPVVLI